MRTTSSVCGGSATGGAEGDNSSSEDGDVDGRPANPKTPLPASSNTVSSEGFTGATAVRVEQEAHKTNFDKHN